MDIDPRILTATEWAFAWATIGHIFAFVVAMIIGAFAFLLGHIAIPSLAATRQLPTGVQGMRPLFYVIALAAFTVAVYNFTRIVVLGRFLELQFYPKLLL